MWSSFGIIQLFHLTQILPDFTKQLQLIEDCDKDDDDYDNDDYDNDDYDDDDYDDDDYDDDDYDDDDHNNDHVYHVDAEDDNFDDHLKKWRACLAAPQVSVLSSYSCEEYKIFLCKV